MCYFYSSLVFLFCSQKMNLSGFIPQQYCTCVIWRSHDRMKYTFIHLFIHSIPFYSLFCPLPLFSLSYFLISLLAFFSNLLSFLFNVTRQTHEREYSNGLHKTILRLSHLLPVSWAFALFYKNMLKSTFTFLFNITLKTS